MKVLLRLQAQLLTTLVVFQQANIANYQCHAFAPGATSITNNAIPIPIPSIIKRAALKKELIKAASSKDEEKVLSLVEELSQFNPTAVPTNGLMGYGGVGGAGGSGGASSSSKAPLNGKWKLLYTNARDAEAPARTEKNKDNEQSQFGDEVASGVKVTTGQRINAATGECINYIQLSEEEDDNDNDSNGVDGNNAKKRKRPFDELEITIQMTPLSDNRVRLDFIKGRATNGNAPLPFLKEFNFNFPPPGFGDLLARVRGLDPAVEPQAYFDILYIDGDIRAHRTGEGKIFVQKRDK